LKGIILAGYTVYVERLPEQVVPGKRLGRNVRHDSRNRLYAHRRQDRQLTSQMWSRQIPILDQGNVGSCTGNFMVGALGTDPLFGALPQGHPALDETLALKIYSAAEVLDGDGPYPPQDNGSTGPSVDQVAKTMGLIAGYTHGFSLADMLDALEDGPVGMGSNWYDSMDSPDSSGLVAVSANAVIRGGHEFLARGKDVDSKLVHFDNSWGTGWGINGSFSMSYATVERLLGEQGDVTVPIPLSAPAPTPTPSPTPTPPNPVPDADPDDVALAQGTMHWAQGHHVGEARRAAKAQLAWLHKRGFL
jgi:hypothetical protein